MSEIVTGATTSAEPSATPTATPAPAIQAAPAAPVTATPPTATPAAPATQGGPEGWVPSYRIRETRDTAIREAQQQWAEREAQYQAQLQQIQSQLHALVGVTPPQNPEIEAVRQQFSQLYPGLSNLEERANDLLGVLDRAGDMESQSKHYWQSYGRQSMERLFDYASKSLGTPLTEDGKRALHSAFFGYVQSSPEITARYTNDPTLIQDFWNTFTSNFIDPARRVASATVAGRAGAALPQDTPSGAPQATPAPKLTGLDERAAAAWAQYNTLAKR